MSNTMLKSTPPHLEITDDRAKMEEIGRKIFAKKPEIYNERLMAVLNRNVDKYLPNATAEEKESALYRSIYDYWVHGNSIMEEFQFDFPNKTHAQKSEYITMRKHVLNLQHLNDEEDSKRLLDDKYGAYKFLKEYYRRDAILITGENDYENFCAFAKKHSVFVVKPLNMAFGLYVYKESVDNYKSLRELFDNLLEKIKTWGNDKTRDSLLQVNSDVNIILEELIEQVPEMAAVHPASLNFIRVTTIKRGDDVSIIFPYFSIGIENNFVNNMSFGYYAVIDLETGVVQTGLFDKKEFSVNSFERHPITNFPVRGFKIPQWDELISMAKELARKFDTINYIGWDLALTPKGWCVIEGNSKGGISSVQIRKGKGILKEFEQLIGWKYDKEFWWQ